MADEDGCGGPSRGKRSGRCGNRGTSSGRGGRYAPGARRKRSASEPPPLVTVADVRREQTKRRVQKLRAKRAELEAAAKRAAQGALHEKGSLWR